MTHVPKNEVAESFSKINVLEVRIGIGDCEGHIMEATVVEHSSFVNGGLATRTSP